MSIQAISNSGVKENFQSAKPLPSPKTQVKKAYRALFQNVELEKEDTIPNVVAASNIIYGESGAAKGIIRKFHPSKKVTIGLKNFFPVPMLSAVSVYTIATGYLEARRASKIEDLEGKKEGVMRIIDGTLLLSSGSLYTTAKVLQVTGHAAVTGLSIGASLAFGITGAIGAGIAVANLSRCQRFSDKLQGDLETTLAFLVGQIELKDHELAKIVKDAGRSGLKGDEKLALIEKEATKAFERKLARFERRTGRKSLLCLLKKGKEIQNKLKDPKLRKEAIREAEGLIGLVKTENKKKRFFYTLMLIASIISIVALVIGTVFSGGTLPLALMAISGAIFFSLSLYSGYIYLKNKVN